MGSSTRATMPSSSSEIWPGSSFHRQNHPQSSFKAVHVSYFGAFPTPNSVLRGAL
jgi:hypothetical protein